MTLLRRASVILALLVLAVPPVTGGGRDGRLLVLRPDRPLELLPAAEGVVPAALAMEVRPGATEPSLWRFLVRDGKLALAGAGRLPAGTLGAVVLPAGDHPVVVASCPGRIVSLVPGEDAAPPRTLAADRRLGTSWIDLLDHGDGTFDLLVPSWAGVLLLRAAGPGRWAAPAWLPLPRSAAVGPGEIQVRASSWATPATTRGFVTLWAEDHREGTVAVYRGVPLAAARAVPPTGPPPLVARTRLPDGFRWSGDEVLMPGTPDVVVRVLGWPRSGGPRSPPHLVALSLVPRADGLPSDPVLDAELPFAVEGTPPLLRSADADGDGTLDILAGGTARRGRQKVAVSVFPGREGGRPARGPLEWTARAGKDPVLLEIGDLDGDGRPDVLAAGRGSLSFWRGETPAAGRPPWSARPTVTWTLPGRELRPDPPVVLVEADGTRALLMRLLPAPDGIPLFVVAFLPRR